MIRRLRSTTLMLSVLLLCSLGPGVAQDATAAGSSLADRVGRMLAEAYPDESGPGAALLVVDDGEVVYRGARGMANVELGVALSPDHVFRLASVSKQFTAAAILILEEQGKLSVSDSITDYFPDYPTNDQTITIEHLLTHTSGIYNLTDLPGYMETEVRQDRTVDEMIDRFKDLEMEFAPGERWNYSNSGYILLGAIVEKVSGQSYAEFVQEQIFQPLGMKDSYYGGHQIVPNRASGYASTERGYENAQYLSMTQPHAAGGLLSTVDDLARWDAALSGGELISEEAYRRMTTPMVLNDGEETAYGYGFSVTNLRGHPAIHHSGGIHGFSTFAVRIPEAGVYIAALSNYPGGGMGPGPLALKVGALMIGEPFPEFERAQVAGEILERYVGVYRIDEGSTRTVTLEDGKLHTQRSGGAKLEAIPYSETGFFYEQSLTYWEVVFGDDGEVSHMLMYHDGSEEGERADLTDEESAIVEYTEADVDPAVYEGYVGRYELAPGFVLTVSRQDDRLFTQATGQPKVEVYPSSETEFFLKVVDAQLIFELDENGKAEAVILHQGGQVVRGARMAN